MSYLLDRKIKRKRFFYAALGLIFFFILFYFHSGIFRSLSSLSHIVFRPALLFGSWAGEEIGNAKSFFSSKQSLEGEIQSLKERMLESEASMSNYNSLLAENISLKEIFGRKKTGSSMILSAILSKPNQSPYDTLVIDVGANDGIQKGDLVFALGNVPLGRISDAYFETSKVILFSNSGVKTQAIIEKNIFVEIVGRGGGNFEMILPRDFTPEKGDEVVMAGIMPYALGVVETIISDPREPFVKALLTSPVNIQELKFVQVEQK